MKSNRTSFTLLIVAFVLCSLNAQAQYITNYAGNGYGAGAGFGGRSGDGGAAYAAELFNPTGVATYGYVNVYIADRANHIVRKVDHNGYISTLAGNDSAGYTWGGDTTAATATRLSSPYGLVADAANNVYISDYTNNVVYKVTDGGIISTIAGNDTAGYKGDGGPAVNARLNHPLGLTLDAANNLYIADAVNNVIRKVNLASGIITTVAGNGYGAGLSLGHGKYTGDGGAATAASLNYPTSVAIDYTGNMFIADASNNVIRKVDTGRKISTYAGTGVAGFSGDGGPAKSAALIFPAGVAADGHGNLFISDQGNNNIRKVAADGTITTIAGNHASGYDPGNHNAVTTQLNAPAGIAVDGNGLIYVADYGNNVVRLIGPASIINGVNTVAGGTSGVKVYPNPCSGHFVIEIPAAGTETSITISDMLGKVIATRTIAAAKAQQVDFSLVNIAPGSYIIKVSAGASTSREKLQIVK